MKVRILIGSLVIAASAPAHAAYLTEKATDSAARSVTPTASGFAASLEPGSLIASGPDYRSGPGGSYRDSILKFALGSALAPGSTIETATLSFTMALTLNTIPQSSPITLQVTGFGSSTPAVGLSDFTTSAAIVGTATVPIGIGTGVGPVTLSSLPLVFDVTTLLQSFLDGGSPTVGFQIDNLTPYTWSMISSGSDSPILAIVYAATVPEPSSLMLVGGGLMLAGFAGHRVRRRSGA